MGTKTTYPIGITPLDDIAVIADNPANQITGDYVGYRKVWLRILNTDATEDVFLTENNATVPSAMLVVGVPAEQGIATTFGPFEPEEINNLGLYAAAATGCIVTALVSQNGEIEDISLVNPS